MRSSHICVLVIHVTTGVCGEYMNFVISVSVLWTTLTTATGPADLVVPLAVVLG